MKPRTIRLVCTIVLAAAGSRGRVAVAVDTIPIPANISFNRDVRPIFSRTCWACHGPDQQAREAELRLDRREEAIADRDGTRVINPGNAAKSEAYIRITAEDPNDRMPPADFHTQLSQRDKAVIRKWIDQGAEYDKHWSFIPFKRPAPPKAADNAKHPIDRFVHQKLQGAGLQPAQPADRETLIRRVTLDLTGLPPAPSDVDRFLNDKSPKAYEKVVDRLLGSNAYAEHMARHWLDAARYADTNGYQYDRIRQQWVWRDWVIHAFKTNMPFDRFTIEQCAGDLLPNATDRTRLATGFHRNHPITIEGGVIDEEYRTEYVMDRVVTTTTTWMGLTFLCARCHDHKYDPITQDDFYSLFAFFNNVPERGLNGFAPKKKIASPLHQGRTTELAEQIEKLEARLDAKVKDSDQTDWEAKLKTEQSTNWQRVDPTSMRAVHGSTLTRLPDGSTLASGKRPDVETYEITFAAGQPISAIRLEALTDDSLAKGSTGRGSNGNFVLSEFEVAVKSKNVYKPIKIRSAIADYEQKNYSVAKAIDGERGRSGWAVDGNSRIRPSSAVFALPKTLPVGTVVRVRLIHEWGALHAIGRFRLSTTARITKPLPTNIAATLALADEKRSPQQNVKLARFLLARFGSPDDRALFNKLDGVRRQLSVAEAGVPETLVLAESDKPRVTFVLERGEYDKAIEDRPAQPAIPKVLGQLSSDLPRNRLGLARWLVSPDNPLTARVIVNRYWAQLFGTGLVKTVEDFGSQGEYPSHPEMLDWLAVEFVESGWDMRHLLKTIVTSDTYCQSSSVSSEVYARDPKNRLLARGPRFRLDAESIRDSALAVSGLLNPMLGGPSVYPYHPKGLWLELNNRPNYSRAYPHTTDASQLYRRSMYTFWKRTVPPPTMATFDAPEREFCIVQRSRTNTPLQAFALLHGPQFVEAARHLAERMVNAEQAVDARLSYGFKLCTSRPPTPVELKVLRDTYRERLSQYKSDQVAAQQLLTVGASPRDESIDLAEHAAYTTVARILLNLSEFVTKG